MSNYYRRNLALAGMDFSSHELEDLRALVRQILENKIHGHRGRKRPEDNGRRLAG